MPTKRAAARRDAAELVDIEARLAPFFLPPVDLRHSPSEDVRASAGRLGASWVVSGHSAHQH